MRRLELKLERAFAAPSLVKPSPRSQTTSVCQPASSPDPARHGVRSDADVSCSYSTCRLPTRLHAAAVEYGADLSVGQASYIALGLAHCFEKDDNGKLVDRMVVEPLAANSLECMANGASTCFKAVTSMTLEDALLKDRASLPEQFADATWCTDYEFRCAAAARTWLRPHAQDNLSDIVPLGQVRSNFNYNVERKRVLNFVNVVSDDDNVKQDMSIDVYGREKKEEDDKKADTKKPAEAAAAQEEEDDLDSLLLS